MASAYCVVNYPEKVPIYSGAWTPSTGTETLASVSVTLRDAAGAVAGSVSGVAATGFDSGAQAAPAAWYDFYPGPLGLNLTEPTYVSGQSIYSLEFVAIDSAGKRYSGVVCIILKPAGS